jgi:hypothetical protein
VKTWKEICDYESRHPKKEISEDTEVIIKVNPEAHSKILEIQADHFHKTEKKQFKALQTIIFHEMKKAVVEQMSKKIIQKQNNMEEIKRRQRMEHEAAVEAKHRMEREEIEEREKELQKEIKLAQKEYMEAVKQKSELEKENLRREKQQQVGSIPPSCLTPLCCPHHALSTNVKLKDCNVKNISKSRRNTITKDSAVKRLREVSS